MKYWLISYQYKGVYCTSYQYKGVYFENSVHEGSLATWIQEWRGDDIVLISAIEITKDEYTALYNVL